MTFGSPSNTLTLGRKNFRPFLLIDLIDLRSHFLATRFSGIQTQASLENHWQHLYRRPSTFSDEKSAPNNFDFCGLTHCGDVVRLCINRSEAAGPKFNILTS
jgi:hypothetical protein